MLPLEGPVFVAVQYAVAIEIVAQRQADGLVRVCVAGIEGHHTGAGRGETQVTSHVFHRLLQIGFQLAADLQPFLNSKVVDQQRKSRGNHDEHDR